jgi:beta-mannosidase
MPRLIVDLNGSDWRLGQAPPGASPERASWHELNQVIDWVPATVPGNVRADLMAAGKLPEISLGRQSEASQWVDNHCWWMVRPLSVDQTPTTRVHLVLRGVDYVSDLFLNGQHLGRHEGMFSPQVHDITHLLASENRLAVRIVGSRWLPDKRSSPAERLLNQIEARIGGLAGPFPHRRDTLKCQMGFGWDFAPPLRTMGIWDDVYAVISQEVFVRDVVARQQVAGDKVVVTVRVEVEAHPARSVQLQASLAGETFDGNPARAEETLELAEGRSSHSLELTVREPRLWWPWDHGRPDLYRLVVTVRAGDRILDSISQTVGLRQVELDGWTLRVNGRRVFARGASWVPAKLLPGRVTHDDYHALLSLALEANMNMVRVWGGGLREKRVFYDLCSRFGILVWQEFPFACALLARYPRSAEFQRLVDAEVGAVIRDLRNHASIALWCGGNEFSPERNAALVATLQAAANREDPTRPFLPASPANGDSHNWKVWHGFESPANYHLDQAPFASEFGLQAPPAVERLRSFIPADELWPPGPSWAHHGAGLKKLWRYACPFLGKPLEASLESFVRASQRAQAHALQIAIEHYRRLKASGGGGVLIWQLNEPWPAISWALVDFWRHPKPAWKTVQRVYRPLLVSVEYPLRDYRAGDEIRGDVWIINDRVQPVHDCHVAVVLRDSTGQPICDFGQGVSVPGDSARIVGSFEWVLPAGDDWQLACALTKDAQILADNAYDLGVHDATQPSVRQRLRSWLKDLLAPS